jgi:hypothetical protein
MSSEIKDTLKSWIDIDDQIRVLQSQIKALRQQKTELGSNVISFMKSNNHDNIILEGPGGMISRSTRISRPALKRNVIRMQLLHQFSDQPERVAEALRAIEGIPEGSDDMSSVGGTPRDILTRRLPRS